MTDPVPGYFDSLLGGLGAGFSVVLGFARTFKADNKPSENTALDIVAVDVLTNYMLVIAWKVSNTAGNCKIIYNCCSGNVFQLKSIREFQWNS